MPWCPLTQEKLHQFHQHPKWNEFVELMQQASTIAATMVVDVSCPTKADDGMITLQRLIAAQVDEAIDMNDFV